MTSDLDRAVHELERDLWRRQLIAARLAAGLTQDDLADRMGVNQSSISFWETGRSSPDMPNWQLWAAVLGSAVQMVSPNQPKE